MEKNTQTRSKTTEKKRWSAQTCCGCLSLLLLPVLSYFLFEYVTGNLHTISFWYMRWNIILIFLLYLIVFALSGRSRFTIPAVSAALFLLSAADAFVVEFRSIPIRLWDVFSLGTAMTVAGNYTFRISRPMAISAVILILANIAAWFFPLRLRTWKKHLAGICGAALLTAGINAYLFLYLLPRYPIGISMWDVSDSYENHGYIFSTVISVEHMFNHAPDGYSEKRLQELSRTIPSGETTLTQNESIQPVNLICIMNESLSDLHTAGDFTTNADYFPFIRSLDKNTLKGSLFVPVFGSMTPNTEFEFLTGDSMHMFPSGVVPFQLYIRKDMPSLVSVLKSQGYAAVAMHPYPGSNWNRKEVYSYLGFDQFLDEDYYGQNGLLRNYVSDREDYRRLIDMVEAKEDPADRLFIFNVTMQNHGGYEDTFDNFEETIHLTGELEGKYPKADQYLSLMKESDSAFEYLTDYFSQCSQPTMIVLFGDHQPSVEDEFYDDILTDPDKARIGKDRLIWYQTPVVIWTNYELPAGDRNIDQIGTVCLSSLVLDAAGLEMSPYQRYLLDIRQTLPVLQQFGCIDSDGFFYDWSELEDASSPYHDLIMDYEYMAYNHVLDSRTYLPLFTLPQISQ